MIDTLEHITITTGGSRHSRRSEVGDSTIDMIRTAVATAAGSLGDTGWSVKMLPVPEGGHCYQLSHDDKIMAICWLCTDPIHKDAFWRSAISAPKLPGTRVHPPLDTPWLAVAMMAGALNAGRELLAECADLERCVAWMLLE